MAIKIGNGEISSGVLLLPKTEFLCSFSAYFKRSLLLGKSDEEIEKILSDLWEASNPTTDGGNTSSKKTKGSKQPVVGADSAEPIGDGTVSSGVE
jgi:hypothetical protein